MNDETPLGDLLLRVRSGDPDAATELLRRYEPAVRLAVRTRLSDPALRRQFDSVDVSQSVFRSFYVRAATGQFDLNEPGNLVGLLVRMALNKLAGQARYYRRERRDIHRHTADGAEALAVVTGGADPGRVVADRDLLARVRAEMSADERAIADCRATGQTWDEVASALGGTRDGRRKQFERAIDRIVQVLGIDGDPIDGGY